MLIKIFNNSEKIFEGDSRQWLEDNEQNQEVLEMIQEVEQTGSFTKDFFHSGIWEVLKNELSVNRS